MESMASFIHELHRIEETAFLEGDQDTMAKVGAELDEIVTDEALETLKGDI